MLRLSRLGEDSSDVTVNSISPVLTAMNLPQHLQDVQELLELALELSLAGQEQTARELMRAACEQLGRAAAELGWASKPRA